MADTTVALIGDHAGFELKNHQKGMFDAHGAQAVDLGPRTADPAYDPGMAAKLAAAFNESQAQRALMLYGSGIGIALAANRYPWLRAAMCYDVTTVRRARKHNDANGLALGARLIGLEVARDCLLIFRSTHFAGGRHARRAARMSSMP